MPEPDPRFLADFGTLSDLVAGNAARWPERLALTGDDGTAIDYAALDTLADRLATALQRNGCAPGDMVGLLSGNCPAAVLAMVGIMRAGGVVAFLPTAQHAPALAAMLADCRPAIVLHEAALSQSLAQAIAISRHDVRGVAIDEVALLEEFLAPAGAAPNRIAIRPDDGAHLIYSSGTTGAPKGILIPHKQRWAQLKRPMYEGRPVTLISTPFYSNTTLTAMLPTLARGGTLVLMHKFDVERFIALAGAFAVTHAMLVPVQYRRILAHPGFDPVRMPDLRVKLCTSAPFSPALKQEVLDRWQGELHEFYGLTEGGLVCVLAAHDHRDKLHTVGKPSPGHEVRFIDEDGRETAPAEGGEIVGRSPGVMTGYHNRPEATAEAWWYDAEGNRFLRTGDVGRLDADGFVELFDRRKDMIISGGFNIYPSDLEAVLAGHPDVHEAAVFGVPSDRWGETPVAALVLGAGATGSREDLLEWANARLGKMQRLADITIVPEMPRNALGKILKRDLRDAWLARTVASDE